MSLQVWLPLHGNLNNYGLSPATFSVVGGGTGISIASTGKTANNSYQRDTINTAGYITSDIDFYFPKDFSMCCWLKVNTVANTSTANGIITHHAYRVGGGGITIKVTNASTCYASFNAGTNVNSRIYHTYYGTTNIFGAWHHIGLTYDRSNTKYRLYVDGILEKEVSFGDTPAPRPFQLFTWATDYVSSSYRPACQLNDVRLYDHCVSTKEMNEIAKGLIAHYPLRDRYIESSVNLVAYPTPGSSYTNNWDASLHPDAISVDGWSPGYNSGVSTGGVKNAEIGYHAHWQLIDGIPTMVFPNINSLHSCTKRWLGISSTGKVMSKFAASTTYTLSYEIMGSNTACAANVGLYYYNTAGTRDFHDGYLVAYGSPTWRRVEKTFTTSATMDASKAVSVYCYGHNYGEGIIYVRNVKLEIGDHATSYNSGSHSAMFSTTVNDCSGYGYHLNKVGTGALKVVKGSARNEYCMNIVDGKNTYLSNSAMQPPVEECTMSCWFKTTSTGYGSYHIPFAIGEGRYEFSVDSSGQFRNGFYVNGSRIVHNISSPKVNDGGWHMLTATFDGSNIRRYIDGNLVNTTAASGTLAGGTQLLTLGHYGSSANYGNNNGYMSDVRLYCTALSDSDILSLYKDSAHIDEKYQVHAYELCEVPSNGIYENGSVQNTAFSSMAELHDMKIKTLDDGSAWARIFWHDVQTEKQWFANSNEVAECNEFNRYSRMGIADKFISKKVSLTNMIPRPTSTNTGFSSNSPAQTSYVKYPGGVGLQITATASVSELTSSSTVTAHYTPGHTYYSRYEIYQTEVVGGSQMYWKIAEPSMGGSQKVSAKEVWTPISFYRTAATIVNRNGADWAEGDYPYRIDFDNSKTAGTMYFDGLMLIDLTEAFGSGHEPTKAWCDANIPFFTGTTTVDASDLTGGWYEFMLTYPRLSSTLYNRWKQTSAPSASASTGYEAITTAWTDHAGGLRKVNGTAIYNCDNVGSSTWYAAIGQTSTWTSTQYIPAANGSSQTETELWVRIDNLADVDKTNIYEQLLSSNDFIEY